MQVALYAPLSVHWGCLAMPFVCPLRVPYVSLTCPLHVPCPLRVPYVSLTCPSSYVPTPFLRMSLVCPFVCPLYVPCMSLVCPIIFYESQIHWATGTYKAPPSVGSPLKALISSIRTTLLFQGRVHEVDLGGGHHGQQSGPDR